MRTIAASIVFGLLAAPGIRLMWVAVRTRRAPELWGGLYFVGLALGLPLRILGAEAYPTDPALGERLNLLGHLFFASGASAMAIFIWRVFRAGSPYALLGAASCVVAIVGTTLGVLLTGNASTEDSLWIVCTNVSRVVPLLWAFGESLRYWRMMSRRAAVGLGDPVVANRFALWAVWTGAMSLLPTLVAVLRLLRQALRPFVTPTWDPAQLQAGAVAWLQPVLFVALPVGVVALWLSFFPPSAYRRWLSRDLDGATV